MLMASMVAYFTAVEVEPEDIFDLIMEQDSIDHVERAGKGMAQVRGVGTDKGVGGRGEAEGTQESVRGDGGAAGRVFKEGLEPRPADALRAPVLEVAARRARATRRESV